MTRLVDIWIILYVSVLRQSQLMSQKYNVYDTTVMKGVIYFVIYHQGRQLKLHLLFYFLIPNYLMSGIDASWQDRLNNNLSRSKSSCNDFSLISNNLD